MEQIGVLSVLGQIPRETIFYRTNLAELLGCHKRTIKRMEERGELPPSVKFHGKLSYIAGAIVDHLARRAARALEQSERDRRRLGLES